MSSNSSADSLRGLFARSLAVLRDEQPEYRRRLADALAHSLVSIHVDDEAWSVGGADGLRIGEASPEGILLRTSGGVIRAILEGTLDLNRAIRSDGLRLRGPLPELNELQDAFAVWMHGLIRAPSAPPLLSDLLRILAVAPQAGLGSERLDDP